MGSLEPKIIINALKHFFILNLVLPNIVRWLNWSGASPPHSLGKYPSCVNGDYVVPVQIVIFVFEQKT